MGAIKMSKVLELVKNIKKEYIEKFGFCTYDYTQEESCILKWARELGKKEYIDILSFLTMRQKGTYVIFKYMKFEVVFTRTDDLNYSDFWNLYDGFYRECRGITIDVEKECIVTRPYDKFFGINERNETSEKSIREMLNKSSVVEFADKLDGSIIIARWYDGSTFISSSGMLDGSYILEKAHNTILQDNYSMLLKENPEYTVMFEQIDANDAHIVSYNPDMYGLHLIGMRHVETGEIVPYSKVLEIAEKYKIKTVEFYNMGFDEILNTRSNYKAQDKEGYVMYIDGVLIKIKCEDYILMHKMWRSVCSMNGLIEAVYKDRVDDLMQSVSGNIKNKIQSGLNVIHEYERLMDMAVNRYYDNAPKDKREFFKWVKDVPHHIGRYVTRKFLYGDSGSYLAIRDDGKQVQYIKYSEMEKIIMSLKDQKAVG